MNKSSFRRKRSSFSIFSKIEFHSKRTKNKPDFPRFSKTCTSSIQTQLIALNYYYAAVFLWMYCIAYTQFAQFFDLFWLPPIWVRTLYTSPIYFGLVKSSSNEPESLGHSDNSSLYLHCPKFFKNDCGPMPGNPEKFCAHSLVRGVMDIMANFLTWGQCR